MRGTKHSFIWGLKRSCGESSRPGAGTPARAGGYGVALLVEALKRVPGMLRGGDISNHST